MQTAAADLQGCNPGEEAKREKPPVQSVNSQGLKIVHFPVEANQGNQDAAAACDSIGA